MKSLTRREFCSAAAALGATALAAPHNVFAQSNLPQISLTINPATTLARVPSDFMGLSYESGQLAYPDFFSPKNSALIEIFRSLSPEGVLRLGGNLSEFTFWSESEPATPPEVGGLVGPDPGHREPRTFTITPRSIQNLEGFLNATGWRCIYGLNLGGGTLEQALAEGGYVAKTLGPKLVCVQFGNEPDLFKHHDQNNKPWTYEEYLEKWRAFRAAFHEKLPLVSVAGPDTAFNQQWVTRFANDAPRDVVMITSHYYPLGPPADPKMTIDLLMHPGARFDKSCGHAMESAKQAGLPFRMAEGNSCYNAGKQGVSDTFASALWAGDFCLQLASMGCTGVNLHGGANGYYSPIVGSVSGGFTVRPEFYGLMMAQEFSGKVMSRVALETNGSNVTAYAGNDAKMKQLAAIFNKDSHDVEVNVVVAASHLKHAAVVRLQAPAIDSKDGVTFAGAGVSHDGHFHPRTTEHVKVIAGKLGVRVPASSAALIRLS